MTATLLAAAWAGVVVLTAAGLARPSRHPDRAADPEPGPAPGGRPRRRSGRAAGCEVAQPAVGEPPLPRPGGGAAGRVLAHRVGTWATRAAAQAVGRPAPVPADPAAVGAGLLLGGTALAALPAAWPLGLVLGALPPLLARAGRHRSQAAAARAVLDELPEVIDLLGLAVSAGLTAPLAVAAVARRGHGVLAAALGGAAVQAARDGRRLADVLDDIPAALGPAGDGARPLVVALADAARHGTALGPSLDRLATEARTARRHRAEERARRVPVLLLFPLVTCTLPALGLLTIAPLAVAAFHDMRS